MPSPYDLSGLIGIRAQPTWNSDTSRAKPGLDDLVVREAREELLHQHHTFEPGDVGTDAHVHAVPEPEVAVHGAARRRSAPDR